MRDNVAGIIVTYNPDLKILKSALQASSPQLEIIYLVDNNSSNFTDIEKIVEDIGGVKIIKLDVNLGLASAQNVAINEAKKNVNIGFIILFDQDSIIENGFINSLLLDDSALRLGGRKVGAIGPIFYDPTNGYIYPATVYLGPFIKRVAIQNSPLETTYLIASGCLIRMDVLEEIGLMKDELFIDYIDVEWSLRAKSKGYNLFMSPNAKMAHTIGDDRRNILGRTVSVHSPFRRYFLVRNSFFMIRKSYIPLGYKLREVTFNLLRVGVALVFSNEKKAVLKSFCYGCYDGIRGRFGPLQRKM